MVTNCICFYFKDRVDLPEIYQVHTGTHDYLKNGIRVVPFHTFCRELGMP